MTNDITLSSSVVVRCTSTQKSISALIRPWIGDFGDAGPTLVRRIFPRVIARLCSDFLVSLHWKELIVTFSFKFVLVDIHRSKSFGRPCLVAVEVGILLDGVLRPARGLTFQTLGEFLHPLGTVW